MWRGIILLVGVHAGAQPEVSSWFTENSGHYARLYEDNAARAAGITSLWLETGSAKAFEPARRLYAAHGFVICPPFGRYREDPLSLFMTRAL